MPVARRPGTVTARRSAQTADGTVILVEPGTGPEEIAGSLAEFVDAVRSGRMPSGEGHSNVLSLAMVEAAIRSAEAGSTGHRGRGAR